MTSALRLCAVGCAALLPALLAACAGSPAPVPSAVRPETAPAVDASTPDAAPSLVHVRVLAMNDFHGNLEPPAGTNGVVVAAPDDPVASLPGTRTIGDAGVALVPAGGAAFLATHVARLRAEVPRTVVVSAGDLTGASPLVSNLFHDEPTVLAMNRIGLDLEALGNHDLDRGSEELLRLQRGGCAPGECDGGSAFAGASFTYLAANTLVDATHTPLFPPYVVKDLDGVKVAFVGETLRQTPSVTSPKAVAGLSFADEAQTVNALVPELRAKGAAAIVLLLHQGGTQAPAGTYDSCVGFSGDVAPILDALDPAIDVVVTAHTHQAYDCTLNGRLVTSAGSYGRLVTRIDLTLDPAARRVVAKSAKNVVVSRDVPADPEVDRLVSEYEAKTHAITSRVVGYVKEDVTGNPKAAGSPSCETPLGDLIADAQLAAATGADVAFMNPGGIRADLVAHRPGRAAFAVTYADAFEVQPFGNALVTMTLTGAQIRTLLDGQFGRRADPRILQPSAGFSFHYTYDRATRKGTVDRVTLRGRPLDDAKSYRVTVSTFLANGGDGCAVLTEGKDRKEGALDVDAFTAYLEKHSSAKAPLAPLHVPSRVQGDGCQ